MLIPVVEGLKYPMLNDSDIWINSKRKPVPHLLDVDTKKLMSKVMRNFTMMMKGG